MLPILRGERYLSRLSRVKDSGIARSNVKRLAHRRPNIETCLQENQETENLEIPSTDRQCIFLPFSLFRKITWRFNWRVTSVKNRRGNVGKYVVCTLKWLNHIPLWRRRVRTEHAYYDERYACTRVSAKVSNVNARLCLHRGMCSGLLVKCREEQRAFLNQRARATPTFVCSRVRA